MELLQETQHSSWKIYADVEDSTTRTADGHVVFLECRFWRVSGVYKMFKRGCGCVFLGGGGGWESP